MRAAALFLLPLLALSCAHGAGPGPAATSAEVTGVDLLPPQTVLWKPLFAAGDYGMDLELGLDELARNGVAVEGPPMVFFMGFGEAALAVPVGPMPLFVPTGWQERQLPGYAVAVVEPGEDAFVLRDPEAARTAVRMAGREPRGPVIHQLLGPPSERAPRLLVPVQ